MFLFLYGLVMDVHEMYKREAWDLMSDKHIIYLCLRYLFIMSNIQSYECNVFLSSEH